MEEPMATKVRSPKFPFIPLKRAIERADQLRKKEGWNDVNINVAVGHWGYKPTSSGGKQTAAALKTYGLITDSGSGDNRSIKLSPLCKMILLDNRDQSEERENAIKTAALNSKLFKELWTKYAATGIPSDANLSHYLIFEKEVNEKSAADIIKNFRETIEFSGLTESDIIDGEVEEEAEDNGEDDNSTTVLVNQKIPANPTNRVSIKKEPGMSQATFPLDEGQATFQWPETISQESYEDLVAWIELLKNRAARSVKKPTDAEKNPSEGSQGTSSEDNSDAT